MIRLEIMTSFLPDETKVKLTRVPGATLYENVQETKNEPLDQYIVNQAIAEVQYEIGEEKIESTCMYFCCKYSFIVTRCCSKEHKFIKILITIPFILRIFSQGLINVVHFKCSAGSIL